MSSWTKANSITEVQACLMPGPPPPRLQVQLNAGVLLNLLLDQPFGERLQEFDAETASLMPRHPPRGKGNGPFTICARTGV